MRISEREREMVKYGGGHSASLKEQLMNMLQSSKTKQPLHKTEILQTCRSLKEAHVYCKINHLSGQVSGPLIEFYIKHALNLQKNKASSCSGDVGILETDLEKLCLGAGAGAGAGARRDADGGGQEVAGVAGVAEVAEVGKTVVVNLEIKSSNGGQRHDQFNFVQLRINHDCDYLFTAYYLSRENVEDLGELYAFVLRKHELIPILARFGTYAHGTVKKLGPIKEEDFWTLDGHVVDAQNTREYALRPKYGDACWRMMMAYRKDIDC